MTMKNSRQEIKRSKYITTIISSVQMNVDDFMQNLGNGENYENTIYQWAITLFDEGKSLKEAINIILQRRELVVLNSMKIPENQDTAVVSRLHQKVMKGLSIHPVYFNLNNSQKKSIKNKIDALIATRLYRHNEIIQFVIGIIRHTLPQSQKKITKNNINPITNSASSLNVKKGLDSKMILYETTVQSSTLN